MREVLIDNWNLTNANLGEKQINNFPNESLSDLLSAIVLWDDVYYLDDGFATYGWISTPKGQILKPMLKPLYLGSVIKEEFENSSNIMYEKDFKSENKKIVAQRALFYHEISKAYGLDYYPIKERAQFLINSINKIDLWTRDEILKREEREILERIHEFDSGKESLIRFPLLSSLIVKNSNGDLINTALDIKNAKEVKRFRKYMDKIDKEINEGNYSEARYVLSLIPQIVDEIENMDRKLNMAVTLKLKITPGVVSMVTGTVLSNMYMESDLINLGLICLTLKEILGESNIEISKEITCTKYPKKFQLSFLRTLGKEYLNK